MADVLVLQDLFDGASINSNWSYASRDGGDAIASQSGSLFKVTENTSRGGVLDVIWKNQLPGPDFRIRTGDTPLNGALHSGADGLADQNHLRLYARCGLGSATVQNGYYLDINGDAQPDTLEIGKTVAGVDTPLSIHTDPRLPEGGGVRSGFRFDVEGSSLKAYYKPFDDAFWTLISELTVTDATFTTGDYCGFGMNPAVNAQSVSITEIEVFAIDVNPIMLLLDSSNRKESN